MQSQEVADITANADVMMLIFQRLELKDQLMLSCASSGLQHLFAHLVRQGFYRSATLKKNPQEGNFTLCNGAKDSRICLTREELRSFQQAYASHIEEMAIECSTMPFDRDLTDFESPLSQLISLSVIGPGLTAIHLAAIARNCPQVAFLKLSGNFNGDQAMDPTKPPHVASDAVVNTLLHMKQLRRLSLTIPWYPLVNLPFNLFCKLLQHDALECLETQLVVLPEKRYLAMPIQNSQLQELTITAIFDEAQWSLNHSAFLSCFRNLHTLNLTLRDFVEGETLDDISYACENLKSLKISNTRFGYVDEFKLPARVTDFNLENCGWLSFENLKQILGETQSLKNFKSTSRFRLKDELFPMASNIESVYMIATPTKKIRSVYYHNPHLKRLHWYGPHQRVADGRDDLETCLNLEELYIHTGFLAPDCILQLKHLTVLHIHTDHLWPTELWNFVVALLPHETLSDFCLHTVGDESFTRLAAIPANFMAGQYTTNMERITLGFPIFKLALHFWLGILRNNPQLQLVCKDYRTNEAFLRELILDQIRPHDNIIFHSLWAVREPTRWKLSYRTFVDHYFRNYIERATADNTIEEVRMQGKRWDIQPLQHCLSHCDGCSCSS